MAGLCEGGNEPPGSLKAKPRPHTLCSQSRLTVVVNSTELVSIVRSRNMFAFSSDETAFNIESYFRTDNIYLNGRSMTSDVGPTTTIVPAHNIQRIGIAEIRGGTPFLVISFDRFPPTQNPTSLTPISDALLPTENELRDNGPVKVSFHYIVSHASDESHGSEKDYLCCNCYVTAFTTSYRTYRTNRTDRKKTIFAVIVM
ncbi:hypothetical protein ANN_24155 [Periplaneta americana]|uniref:Uncharacterized protein n=1 Tax=Periplaneta americana TaxID=6978 RepID=A0ABQ8S2B2_PERAM|nr:hypothetical protein ANN_24155 [Periplaneta americana]